MFDFCGKGVVRVLQYPGIKEEGEKVLGRVEVVGWRWVGGGGGRGKERNSVGGTLWSCNPANNWGLPLKIYGHDESRTTDELRHVY